MARWLFFLAALVVIPSVVVYLLLQPPPLPTLEEEWWGPESPKGKEDISIKPFKIKFKESMVKDLQTRLSSARPLLEPLAGWSYGAGGDKLQTLANYWRQEYRFTEREKLLNRYPHYTTYVQGLKIHFIHVKPKVAEGVKTVPVLMMHGWPGSVVEFLPAADLLVKDNLELVIPSLPGYGFSDGASRPGLGAVQVAVVLRGLMRRLGHQRYVLQGGDWGAIIGSNIATLYPEEIIGFHTNMPLVMSPMATLMEIAGSFYPPLIVEDELAERMYPLSKIYGKLVEATGYMHIQSTKPDTVGVALQDSPIGLMAYILEKFDAWTLKNSTGGEGLAEFSKDELIDNLMMYWVPGSITTSMRLYAESFNKKQMDLGLDRIPAPVPTWAVQPYHEIAYQPPAILRLKYPGLLRAVPLPYAGHFLALQRPEDFADSFREAVEQFLLIDGSRKL